MNKKQLKVNLDDRGYLVELFRESWNGDKCKQVYMTTTRPGIVKGWHRHKKQIDNVVCIKGAIKLVLYNPDDLNNRSDPNYGVKEICMGEHDMKQVQILPGTYHGWVCISSCDAIIINCVTEEHNHADPDEERIDPHDDVILTYIRDSAGWTMASYTVPYIWDVVDR